MSIAPHPATQRPEGLRTWLVDPSLFTAPYDAALTQGLIAAGTLPLWITRPTRRADRQELPLELTDPYFYRHVDQATWIPALLKPVAKGLSHLIGWTTLLSRVRKHRPDVVHIQWIVVPLIDTLAMTLLRRWCPVVLTVHDTVPFNGQRLSALQRFGHAGPKRLAHRVIVHTRGGREALIEQGVAADKIETIPHGSLRLATWPPAAAALPVPRDPRYTFVLFGEIKHYKGIDVMIDAVARLPQSMRARLRVIVAGRPRMDVAPLLARITDAGLDTQFDLRLNRLSEEEMALLFHEADSVVFAYRQIDASGVYYLVKSLGKWLIASAVGAFAEEIVHGVDGTLVPPGDAAALADALQDAVQQRPTRPAAAPADSWTAIGRSTHALYLEAITAFARLEDGQRQRIAG